MVTFRVLSEHPLNAEPPLEGLSSPQNFVTPTTTTFHRNHGEIPSKDVATYSLAITSEVPGLSLNHTLSFADLERARATDVISAISCAGNRRREMNEAKEVEGLQWGGSAIANSHFSGPLLRQVLEDLGISLQSLLGAASLHIHFETSQKCEEAEYYGSSLPAAMALDPERPVLLATHMNGAPLDANHGKPCRLVVPGIIGARSVKWLERIVIRQHPSENFYMTRDYKILPPETTPETKEEDLKHVEPLMELPLNSEICEPVDGSDVEVASGSTSIEVRGYALGSRGTPISSVKVALVPLPLSHASPSGPDTLPQHDLHRIRQTASELADDDWTHASLIDRDPGETTNRRDTDKNWAWTLFSATVALPDEVATRIASGNVRVAFVAFATDADGERQELQTPYNLRGVAEASWPVSRVRFVHSG
ncbi:hypothetical protein JCM11491_001493 [Sporobolomyces phaffii]